MSGRSIVRTPRRFRKRVWLAIAALTLLSVAGGLPNAWSAAAKRSIDIEIKLPSGAKPHFIMREDEGLIVPLPDHTQYGFVAVIRDKDTVPIVIVTIWDVRTQPARRLGEVEAVAGGPAVVSDTTPPFAIRILRVIEAS
jgi:hypothetical protein